MPKRSSNEQPAGLVRKHPTEYRVERTVTATEASRNLSDLLSRIRYRGETFIVMRGGRPICELRPASPGLFTGSDLVTLLRSLPEVDAEYLDAVEATIRDQPMLPESPWVP